MLSKARTQKRVGVRNADREVFLRAACAGDVSAALDLCLCVCAGCMLQGEIAYMWLSLFAKGFLGVRTKSGSFYK